MHPILVKTDWFTIYSYGACMALAVLIAWALSAHLARRFSYPEGEASDILFILFASGVVGARLFYVVQHAGEYAGRWHAVFFLQEGGLVWYGGFIGAVAAGMVYAAVKRLPILRWADLFSAVLPLGHAAGRFGCFLNGCCPGKAGHAVQLYESVLLATLSVWLLSRLPRKKKDGEVFAQYLMGYALIRFSLEFLRADQSPWMAGLTLPQWISLALAAAGVALFFRKTPHARD